MLFSIAIFEIDMHFSVKAGLSFTMALEINYLFHYCKHSIICSLCVLDCFYLTRRSFRIFIYMYIEKNFNDSIDGIDDIVDYIDITVSCYI